MTARRLTLALVALMASPGAVALAQRHHGGGGGQGGHGGGYAVARRPAGGGAPISGARHPQAGSGWGRAYSAPYHGGGHYGGGGYYGGSRYYGGYYRPYYGYGYRPYYYGGYYGAGYYGPGFGFGVYGGYYSPGFYGSISIGSPYYSAPYYAPYPAPSGTSVYIVGSNGPAGEAGTRYESAPAPTDDAGSYAARPSDDEAPWGRLRLEVRPDDATVYVDDQFRGSARAARSLRLSPGRHVVELVRPGFAVERHEVEIVDGEQNELLVELRAVRP